MKKLQILAAAFVLLPLAAQAQGPAAEIVLVTGVATVGTRALSVGDKLKEGDTVVTGRNSYANLRFADGGRVLLRPNSEFTVEKYTYVKPAAVETTASEAPVAQNAFFRLVRGGFRAISGLIGKGNAQNYRVTTPTATIGIRGTDYEAQLCTDDCPETETGSASAEPVQVAAAGNAPLQLAQAEGSGSGGLVVATNEGSVVIKTPRGEFTVDAGQVALATLNGQVFQLPAVPDLLLFNPVPSPERCQ